MPLNVIINGEQVTVVSKATFLGVIVDNSLTWKYHIEIICNKIAKSIGIIKKVKYKLNRNTLINLYYTFVYPYLVYCNNVWGNAAKVYINKLLILQKRVLRTIFNVGYRDSTKELFIAANIMNVYDLYLYSICMIMFKHHKELLPITCYKLFSLRKSIHDCNTRNNRMYHLALCRTETRKKTIVYTGPYYFNQVLKHCSDEIRHINSIHMFKKKLKRMIKSGIILS